MERVYCFPDSIKKNKPLLRCMQVHHFQPVFADEVSINKVESGFRLALIDFEQVNDWSAVHTVLSDMPVSAVPVFMGISYQKLLQLYPRIRRQGDLLVRPYQADDVVNGLKRCQFMIQADRDLSLFKEELKDKHRMLNVYKSLTKSLTSTLNLKQLLNKVKDKNSRLLRCASLSIYLYNAETKQLDYIKTRKKDHLEPTRTSFAIGQGIPGQVFQSGKIFLANSPHKDSLHRMLKKQYSFEIQSICCLPLTFKDRYLGVVEAINKDDGKPFEDSDLVILQILSDHAAIAIENSILFERVKTLTIIDDLTQAYNFRFFNIMLINEFWRAKRFSRPLSLLFLDLDGFKRVNDHYGHMTGSMVLREIAAMIKTTVRKSDVVARFGGDEFTVILPNTGMEGAGRVARRIQQRIEAFRYPIPGWNIPLSGSIGISSFPEHVKTKDELLKVADKAMYKIKENQRRDVSIGIVSHGDIQKLAQPTHKRKRKHAK
ncbi:sensor domain-containing diguanylate cyclase [bacterium]|nr:sensor domain-containing diguanylate cyclase [bacterium]